MLADALKGLLPRPRDDDEAHANLKLTARVLTLWVAGSLLSVLVWGATLATGVGWAWIRQILSVFGPASIVASGAFAVGALFGFLFGIPKTLQDQAGTAAQGQGKPEREAAVQATNTNLEQISDWLTKILVGVGLTQLYKARGELGTLGNYFAVASAPAVTLAMVLNFSIAGFLTGYLLTRLFLTGAFMVVERSIRDLTRKAEQLQQAGQFDAALVRYESALKQLSPDTPREQRSEIYEGLIFNSLYEPAPRGFQKAIDYGTQYLSDQKASPNAKILAYLAGAYGQQWKYERDQKRAPQQTLEEIRSKALEAARKALEANPGVIELLRMMWDPSYPSKSPGDDDLEVFFDDKDFRALLGQKPDESKLAGLGQPRDKA
jgi:tetratricopeptide (TPR) repeat protein